MTDPVRLPDLQAQSQWAADRALLGEIALNGVSLPTLLARCLAAGLGTGGGSGVASGITFDPTGTGLTSVEVQAALEEIAANFLRIDWTNADDATTLAYIESLGFEVTTGSVLGSTPWGTNAGKAIVPLKTFAPYGIVAGANHTSLLQKALDSGEQVFIPPLNYSSGGTPLPYNFEHLEVSNWSSFTGVPGLTYLRKLPGSTMTGVTLRPGTERQLATFVLRGLIWYFDRANDTCAPKALAFRSQPSSTYDGEGVIAHPDPYWRIEQNVVVEASGNGLTTMGRFGASVIRDNFFHSIGSTQTIAGNDSKGIDHDGFDGKLLNNDTGSTAAEGLLIRRTWGATNTVTANKHWFPSFDQSPGGATVNQKGRFPAIRDDGKNNVIQTGAQDCQGEAYLGTNRGGTVDLLVDGINKSSKLIDATYVTVDGSWGTRMGKSIRVACAEQNSTNAPGLVRFTGGATENVIDVVNRGSDSGVPNYLRQMIYGSGAGNVVTVNGRRVHV